MPSKTISPTLVTYIGTLRLFRRAGFDGEQIFLPPIRHFLEALIQPHHGTRQN